MKLLFIIFTFCFLLFAFAIPVSAHVLKTDGSIGAILHIDPEDDPIASQQAGFFFEFKDKQNKFKLDNCTCTFSITEDGKQIFTNPLSQDNIFFTFPERNIYQVKVVGKPKIASSFQPFTLTYDVRVDRTSANQPSSQTNNSANWFTRYLPHLIFGIAAVGFLIVTTIKKKGVI